MKTIFVLLFVSMTVWAQVGGRGLCEGSFYKGLHSELRCVACGIQQISPTQDLPSPGWLSLLAIGAQKFHHGDNEEVSDDARKTKLIQMVSTYGVCFNPNYRAFAHPGFWEGLTGGFVSWKDIDEEKKNQFWNNYGVRLDSAALGGLFGCDEEKGCDSGFETLFSADSKWNGQTPDKRQATYRRAIASVPNEKVRIQGGLAQCLNQTKEQMEEVVNGVAGAFNLKDSNKSAPNQLNMVFCQSLANSCGVDPGFCLSDWGVSPPHRGVASENK